MTTVRTLFNREQQLTSVKVVAISNLIANYYNGPLNNGVNALLSNAGAVAPLTIDSVVLNNGDRVLVQNQTDGLVNGIYDVLDKGSANSIWVLVRAKDFHSIEQIKAGYFVPVESGTVNAGSIYILIEPVPLAIGYDDINFVAVGSSGGGPFLEIVNNLSDVANTTISFNNISPLTTKGDMLVHNGTNNVRLPVGADGFTLVANSADPEGIEWVSNNLPLTTKGDLLVNNGTTNVRLPVGANAFILSANSADPEGIEWIANSSATSFNNIQIQRFTTVGAFTYTPSTDMQYAIVEMVAGGGGAGGVLGAVGQSAAGSGGGGGCYLKFLVTAADIGVSVAGAIGAGGASGSNTGGNGSPGNVTTFGDWTAGVGAGGSGATGSASYQIRIGGLGGVGVTGTFGTFIYSKRGGDGGNGSSNALLFCQSGYGGNGLGNIIRAQNTESITLSGRVGDNPGDGGSGAVSMNTATGAIGGAGADGIVIVTEFCN